MTGGYLADGRDRSAADKKWVLRAATTPLGVFLTLLTLFLAVAAHASALTVGVGWANPAYTESEMPQVAHSGAQLFRVPLPPQNNNDGIVAAAARNHVTIEANIGGGPTLPSGTARTSFISEVEAEVRL